MFHQNNYHQYIDDLLSRRKGIIYFNENLLQSPITLLNEEINIRDKNFIAISNFFDISLNIFKEVCSGSNVFPKIIKSILLNDSSSNLSPSFYEDLDENIWTTPKFYRTDESRSGKIFEIQCSGSGWGDVILLEKLYKRQFGHKAFSFYDIQKSFVEEVKKIVKKERPTILHLLDNSSNPSSMRFFINETANDLGYWGYDKMVKNSECDFIRSHSVYGLIAENLFTTRLQKAKEKKVFFDLPPIILFDQKMILCLPFLDETKHLFNDAIRNTLSYTYMFTPSGFRDANGEWVTVENFLKRKPSERKYFIKYGGCDTSLNWGSRAVYRLDSNSCKQHIELALKDFKNDRPWIIQKDCSNKEEISFFERGNNVLQTKKLTAKYSTFYGPSGMLAIRTHHRQSTKVHGQEDSIAGMAYSK